MPCGVNHVCLSLAGDMFAHADLETMLSEIMCEAEDPSLVADLKDMFREAEFVGSAVAAEEGQAEYAEVGRLLAPRKRTSDKRLRSEVAGKDATFNYKVAAYSMPLAAGYDMLPTPRFVGAAAAAAPVGLGRAHAVSVYIKATCKIHSGAPRKCTAWFRCDKSFHDAQHAAHVWLVRGHALGLTFEEHLQEGQVVRPILEAQWAVLREARDSATAASSTGP